MVYALVLAARNKRIDWTVLGVLGVVEVLLVAQLVVGIVQIGVGGLILARHPSGLLLGVVWAAISATLTVIVIFTYPFWALAVLAVEILIIWGLLDHADEFTQ